MSKVECVGGPRDGESIPVPAWLNANGGIVREPTGVYRLEIRDWYKVYAVWQGSPEKP